MGAKLFATPDNPAPDNYTASYFTTHDGIQLRYGVFRSAIVPARGTVVLLHGRNECIEKYFETIRDLNDRGLWVATYDFRGQGGSARLLRDGMPGHVRRFSDYERDLTTFLEDVVLPDTRMPFFLLGHSTGSLIALSAATRLESRIERMVLCAPFIGIAHRSLSLPAIHCLSRLYCLAGLGKLQVGRQTIHSGFENNPLTSDERRFNRNAAFLVSHPELGIGLPTALWLREAVTAIRRVTRPEHHARIRIPSLVIAPTRDGVIPYADQERLTRYFRASQLVTIYGSRHEILQERDVYRAQALAAIHAFIPGSDAVEQPAALAD